MIFLVHIFSKHGTPTDIILDWGKHFISWFWRSLCRLLNIKANLSTAYHPETDRQTERVNQILEQYLCIFVNYQQDNWEHLLPLAEFAYNNTQHSATSVTPFFANKGFHLQLKVSLDSVPSESAHEMASNLKELHQYLCEQLQHTIKQYERHSEGRCLPIPDFQVSDLVWLES